LTDHKEDYALPAKQLTSQADWLSKVALLYVFSVLPSKCRNSYSNYTTGNVLHVIMNPLPESLRIFVYMVYNFVIKEAMFIVIISLKGYQFFSALK
jgi:hypothetical protein